MSEPTYYKRCDECDGEARRLVSESPPENGFITRVYRSCGCERGFIPGDTEGAIWRMVTEEHPFGFYTDGERDAAWRRMSVLFAAAVRER